MAANVFGNPVTEGSRTERALEAFKNDNVDNKHDKALAYVNSLNEKNGSVISTRGIFYNATGEPMTFIEEHSFEGTLEGNFPFTVENGQWGTFFHTKKSWALSGSSGYGSYVVKVDDTKFCKLLFAWSAPFDEAVYGNLAYCDLFEGDQPSNNVIEAKMNDKNTRECPVTKWGIKVESSINMGHNPLYVARFFREDVEGSPST